MESTRRTCYDDERTTRDLVFEALSHSKRRRILRYLDTNGGEMTVSRLGSELATGESASPSDTVSQVPIQQTLVSLVHIHFPKLLAAGLIEWDDDVVSLSKAASTLPLSRPLEEGLLYGSLIDHRPQV